MSKDALVVMGEASESDDEESTPNLPTVVPLRVFQDLKGDDDQGSEGSAEIIESEEDEHIPEPKYDTLLHWKLKEKNADFRRNLCYSVGQVYVSSAGEMKNISQQLVKTHSSLQDVSSKMRSLTNELFHLEDQIDIINNCFMLPDIDLNNLG